MTDVFDGIGSDGDESGQTKSPDQGTSKGGTTVNLAVERHKRKKKDQINRSAVLRMYLKVMLKDPFAFTWPAFPKNLKSIQLDGESRIPTLVNKGDELEYLSSDGLFNLICQYSELVSLSFGHDLALRPSEIRDIAAQWLPLSEAIPESAIAPVRFMSESGYTYKKLDFDPNPYLDTPVFDEMINRIDNQALVMAWIGSLFVAESSRQNYLWLHGTGGQGKSSLSLFLKQCFGKAYRSEAVPDSSSKRFWASGITGSRLVVFPDCNESYFVTTSLFKQITGDDAVRIEVKGQSPMARDLTCKCMFISNNQPQISGLKAEFRRLILAEIQPLPEDIEPLATHIYLAQLWAERSGFIGKCLKEYSRVFHGHGNLSKAQTQSMAGLADLIADNEEWADEQFNQYFKLDRDSQVPGKAFLAIARREKWKNTKLKKFYEYLERKASYVKRKRDIKGSFTVGLAFKSPQEAKFLLEYHYEQYREQTDPQGMDDSF